MEQPLRDHAFRDRCGEPEQARHVERRTPGIPAEHPTDRRVRLAHELPVVGEGREIARFVLEPDPERGVSLEERVVAVAMADQLGAVLAAHERALKSGKES